MIAADTSSSGCAKSSSEPFLAPRGARKISVRRKVQRIGRVTIREASYSMRISRISVRNPQRVPMLKGRYTLFL